MDFEALEAIRQLKHRYLRSLDLKQWDDYGDTLCEDIVGKYGSPSGGLPAEFRGRDSIVEFMRNALDGKNIISVHVANHPEITVDGDTASGSWCLEDTIIAADYGLLIRGAAYYHDTYRREDGVWRIATTGYQRLYEYTMATKDLPSFTLTANLWAPGEADARG